MEFTIIVVIGIILVAFFLLRYNPAFGGRPSGQKLDKFNKSKNYFKGKFINEIPTPMDTSLSSTLSILIDFIKGNPRAKPDKPIPAELINSLNRQSDNQTKITWFGHSTLLLEMEGIKILLDPMFAKVPSPFPPFGGKRYSPRLPIELEKLPPIDAVILSHDHYDHLDFHSIKELKDKVKQFHVPLGVGSHLERWGVQQEKIQEHDWWDESKIDQLTLACTPARHFSGRSLFDRDSTLWSSWVILGLNTKVYFSGDTGYGPHFKDIGEKYGPFDITLLECGQYDKRWSTIHMMPEETVQAHLDVKGSILIPIHWASFTLALHDWTEPVERVIRAAKEREVRYCTPKIGEAVIAGSGEYPCSKWWR